MNKKGFKRKLMLWKFYLDTGMGITSYAKYLIGFFALASGDVYSTLYIGFAYAVVSFIVGFYWCKYKLMDTYNDVVNDHNPFQREVRKKLKPLSKA